MIGVETGRTSCAPSSACALILRCEPITDQPLNHAVGAMNEPATSRTKAQRAVCRRGEIAIRSVAGEIKDEVYDVGLRDDATALPFLRRLSLLRVVSLGTLMAVSAG